MEGSYAKVFRTMFTGSMYGAGLHVFATWAWILTHKDEHGLVEVNTKLVAAELGAEVDQIERAIAYLTAPDPESRSHEEDGRRMVRMSQFGYRVVNHAKYREHGKDRTEYWRDYKANKRSESQKNSDCPQMSTDVHSGQSGHSTKSTHAETDANANTEAVKKKSPSSEAVRLADLLEGLIRSRKPDFIRKGNWAKDIDLMIRLDHRDPSAVEALIRWCQADVVPRGNGFCWANNILCGSTLRDKYDRLDMERKGQANAGNRKDRDFDSQQSSVGCTISTDAI